jgi:hypothetical protein
MSGSLTRRALLGRSLLAGCGLLGVYGVVARRVASPRVPLSLLGDERERVLTGIAAHRGAGIYGADYCQVCGTVGCFHGWAQALACHRHGEFVASEHRHGEDREALRAAPGRFCAVCGVAVDHRRARAVDHRWLCGSCAIDACRRSHEEASELLQRLSRRRYVELKSDEEIRSWGSKLGVL